MFRKQIAIVLSAAALSLSAVAANAAGFVHTGDENNVDWLPTVKAVAPVNHTVLQQAFPDTERFVHAGDENNLDWLPTTKPVAPVAHFEFRETQPSQFVHFGDENFLDWLPAAKA